MKESCRSLVEPRAFAPITNEPLPLVDLVLKEQDSQHRTIRLVGQGIETAISYLQNAFLDYPNICIVGRSETVDSPKKWDVVVFASSGEKCRPHADLELKLKSWGTDEVIEYLMAKSTARCKSVMQRLEVSDDLWVGGGSPRVLSIVLDQMIESDEIISVEDAILRYYDLIDFNSKTRRDVTDLCLDNLFSDAKASLALYDSNIVSDDIVSFLGNQTVRYVIAADKIIKTLEKRIAPDVMFAAWPQPFIRMIAGKIRDDVKTNSYLNKLANKKGGKFSSNAVSLLVFNDRNWRPSIDERHAFSKASLAKVNWTGQNLRLASLSLADLSHAMLSKCDLGHATLSGGDFSSTCFTGANLAQTLATYANFRNASMRAISALNCKFAHSDLTDANMECSDLSKANFSESILVNANLSNCNLQRAKFLNANLENVDFTDSTMVEVKLRNADLRTAILTGADFSGSAMKRCDLRTQILDSIKLEGVSLAGALLTGTVLRNCKLRRATLAHAKMADIDWEDCDLRDANFFNCHFLMGSTRAGTVDSPFPSHGTRTGYYTDDYDDHYFKSPEEIRKANLCRCNLLGAKVFEADFYLVDLRGAIYDEEQRLHFDKCGAILKD